jgi:hypothetical protein
VDSFADLMLKDIPSEAAGPSWEVESSKKELSEVGWFFVLAFLAVIIYLGRTKLLPKLPGGKA